MEEPPVNSHEILGVKPGAPYPEIRAAFVAKAKQLIAAYRTLVEIGTPTPLSAAMGSAVKSPETLLSELVVTLDGRAIRTGQKLTQRLLSRIPTDRDIAVTFADKSVHFGRLNDLSGSGARIMLKHELALGELIEIGTVPPTAPFVLAQVARVIAPGREYGVKWLQIFEPNLPRGWLSDKRL